MKMEGSAHLNPLEGATYCADVVVLGAGPVGLTLANYLAMQGIEVLVIERLDALIDYPRAIGIDDEALRTIQSIGLVEQVLPHTTPYHSMRFLTPKGRCFADIQPMTDEFGFSRRNAFIQPQVDAVLHKGLERFSNAKVLFSREVTDFEQDAQGVTVQMQNATGQKEYVVAKYLVACDGGNSYVRRKLGITFEGKTAPNQWIVVDIANDPLGTPNIHMCCDPVRPYVSAALPHGIRRFEFMVMPGETEAQLSKPENMRKLLSKVLPDSSKIDLIRQRVYTHNARIAGVFRKNRIMLAGDAAHIMPVWQGQGYNSGLRDASNLGWKLAMVVKGLCSETLLDTYQQERRDHAKAMIDLSVTAGKVLAPARRWHGAIRDALTYLMNYVPSVKRYFVEMRFKPMPRYQQGVIVPCDGLVNSPVGRMFPQPKVMLADGRHVLLDDVIGNRFAILAWGTDPAWGFSQEQLQRWRRLDAALISIVPTVQLQNASLLSNGVVRIGDSDGRLKTWFGQYPASVVILRPDRFVAAMSIPVDVGQVGDRVLNALQRLDVTGNEAVLEQAS